MQTLDRVQAAKELTNAIVTGLYDVIVNTNSEAGGYVDRDAIEYAVTQVEQEIAGLLDTPNNTLPSLDRLREAAEEHGFEGYKNELRIMQEV